MFVSMLKKDLLVQSSQGSRAWLLTQHWVDTVCVCVCSVNVAPCQRVCQSVSSTEAAMCAGGSDGDCYPCHIQLDDICKHACV